MKKILLPLFMAFAMTMPMAATTPAGKTTSTITDKEKYALFNEAEDFIDEFNDGSQDVQADAIRHAMRGQGAELQQIRNKRNAIKGSARTDVTVKDIEGTGAARSIPMKLYRSSKAGNAKLPLLVYFHGGGWTIGSISSCAKFCADLAATGNVEVLAIEYSLAPENKYPKPMLDCVDALEFAINNAAKLGSVPGLVSVGGDSSGGNLAIASTLYLLDKQPKTGAAVRSLVLFYPVLKGYEDKSAEWKKYSKGYGLDSRLMTAYIEAYTGKQESHDYLVSPADATDTQLKKMPPVLIVSAERDILVTQGREFASRLSKLGKKAQRVELPGAVHLFITVEGQPTARAHAVSLASSFLKKN